MATTQPAPRASTVEFRNVTKRYDSRAKNTPGAVNDLSLTVPVMISAISVNPDASYTLIAVGIMLSVAAPILVALVFRRYITSGLVASLTRN